MYSYLEWNDYQISIMALGYLESGLVTKAIKE